MVDHLILGAALALPAYLGWWLARMRQAVAWIQTDPSTAPPDLPGVPGYLVHLASARTRRHAVRIGELRDLVEQVRSSAHALPDSIVVLDRRMHIQWSNQAAARLLGVHREHDRGQLIANLIRHPDFVRYRKTRLFDGTVTIPSPIDPERILSIRMIPYGDGQFLLIGRDETEAARLEQKRRDFISNVSHELKTPLTVLGGYLETMADAPEGTPERWRRPLGAMRDQVRRMTRLVQDLLTLSRIESVDEPAVTAPVSVVRMLAEMHEEAAALSGGARRLSFDVEPDLCLLGEESELRAAFSNLITNAIQYTAPGGSITVSWRAEGDAACFRVEDDGEGIDRALIPRLSERFYRIDPGRSRGKGGTGLGLAIVKHVMLHYGGQLEIASEPGRGSTFTCRFPEGTWVAGGDLPPVRESA